MRGGAFVIDAVALLKDFGVITDSDLERTLEHKVELLSAVGGCVDRLVLQLLGVFILYPIGLGKLITEKRSKV